MRNNKKTVRHFAYRSFWPELETMKKFYDIGVDTFCFYAANTANLLGEPYSKYPPVWVWDDTYVFENLDRQIDDILSVAPQAKLLCMIDLNTPFWYVRHHGNNGGIYDSFDQLGRTAYAARWRQDTAKYLQEFIKHVQSRYADHIVAYTLACGSTCEWIDRSCGDESTSRLAAYQDYCREYEKSDLPAPDEIPSRKVRFRMPSDGLLRDPEHDAEALRYWRFGNRLIGDTIEFFAVKAREALAGASVELGTFYGYILQLGGRDVTVSGGHLDYDHVFGLQEFDFFVSPGIYYDRAIGGGGGTMMPLGTLKRYGKRFLHECDQRTHTFNDKLSKYAKLPFLHFADETETVAGMKREFAFSLLTGSSMWWFDMWGGYYQGENIYALLRQMRKLWDEYSDLTPEESAETLLVVDPASAMYMQENDDRSYEFSAFMVQKLNHFGAPYRVCSFNDLDELPDINRIKFIIMAMPFYLDEARQELLQTRICRDGRTIMWLYAPGIITEKGYDTANVEEICGVPFATPGITSKNFTSWQSLYVSDPAELTAAELTSRAATAGVHIFTPNAAPVYDNANFCAIHTAPTEKLIIDFPPEVSGVTELFSGRSYPPHVEIPCPAATTLLFKKHSADKK